MNPEARLFIDGELCEASGGRQYPNLNPATEEVMGQVADATADDMERAIAAARRAFDTTDWSTNHAFRLECIKQLKAGLLANLDDFKAQIAAETGSPLGICGTGGPQCEVPISFMDYTIASLPDFQWSRDIGVSEMMGMKSRRLVEKEAVGVVACVTPWNVPLQINLAKCVPALAAGCTVVLKPAPDTPWAATLLGRVVKECTDIPPGVFNVVTASDPREVAEQLVSDARVDMVSFTGSTAVGKHIMVTAAQTVKKVFLELGGKSANIMLDDADLSQSLLSALGVCFHAGQGCAIQTRLLIPRNRQAEVEELLKTYFTFIEYGDPASDSQIMGALVNAKQRERVLAYIEKGKAEGARLLLGGGVPAQLGKGFYVEPTVFVDVTNDMTIAREEIFGPVLAVIAYDDEEDAIRIANDSDYGLSAGVWSADEARALRVARRLRSGTVCVNGGNFYSADAPFGGYKHSGVGREMGPEGFEEYLETKTIAVGV
ncbi:aldehyde dehydrogenase family protein [Parahaliea mediterranea]|uniref:aldehyde dehydrogenase family protein n=1 Tax=Parahaliea mediterranea TaxID=651086 RepID=UPI000E2EFB36|nr:aldehyde dehydrogenase family protein [Parahaliea mediterranea]